MVCKAQVPGVFRLMIHWIEQKLLVTGANSLLPLLVTILLYWKPDQVKNFWIFLIPNISSNRWFKPLLTNFWGQENARVPEKRLPEPVGPWTGYWAKENSIDVKFW